MNNINENFHKKKMVDKESQDLLCPHFIRCSGCEVSKNLKEPPILNEALDYFEKKGVALEPLVSGKLHGYRIRAKLVVRGDFENPKIGLYKKKSHEVEEIPFCRVHHPKINEAIFLIKAFIKENQIEPYNEATGRGLLKYIQLTVERFSQKVQVAFVLNCDEKSKIGLNLSLWEGVESSFWHSIWINYNPVKTNTIFGSSWVYLKGARELFQTIGNKTIAFHPGSFMQANLELFEKLISSLEEKIPNNLNVVEYYAGVGVIGFKILDKSKSVICSEIAPLAEISFNETRNNLSPIEAKKISFQNGPSEKNLHLLEEKELVIVDPPRKGLDLKLLDRILKASSVRKIVYISCGFKAFQRDCDHILNSAVYKLERVQPFLFFPGSNHLELLAIFSKVE